MKAKVYIETSIPSYLCARRSRDLIIAANQELTMEWWDERNRFDLYISELVIQEASSGDPAAAQKRIECLNDISELDVTVEVEDLSNILIQKAHLPKKAKVDALHIAVAVLNGMDYLLTWNCAHIANAVLRPKMEAICREYGYEPPTICTPQELMRYD